LERPPARPVDSPKAIVAVCAGLHGVQVKACITGASLIRSADPFAQMRTCSRMPAGFEVACARGVRVPGVALAPSGERMGLISDCGAFERRALFGCFWWLGLSLNVVTNGRFAKHGCPELGSVSERRWCAEGASAYQGPLVTFS
jgi:hypothetical protein